VGRDGRVAPPTAAHFQKEVAEANEGYLASLAERADGFMDGFYHRHIVLMADSISAMMIGMELMQAGFLTGELPYATYQLNYVTAAIWALNLIFSALPAARLRLRAGRVGLALPHLPASAAHAVARNRQVKKNPADRGVICRLLVCGGVFLFLSGTARYPTNRKTHSRSALY
jgi:hypothetical protein